jgi:NAD(P)-dependent dehydrogenase (short-subunit alcohol dehydrogenase family)
MSLLDLAGKRGLVLGIANANSIAYGCAKAFHAAGAELAITYLNAKAEPYVRPLAEKLDSPIIVPCDVREPGQRQQRHAEASREQCSRGRGRRGSLRVRITRELGSVVAALGGLDALVFTARIGEHAAPVRARVCENAAWLGIQLDAAANLAGGPRISSADSPVSVWVVPTNEELMIARHTLACTRP